MAIIKVKTGGITADAITDALIADDVVGTEHLTANEVDTTALKGDAVTGAELADDAVNSEHYTDGSIDTAHLADGQVTTAKLATAVFTGATDIGAAIVDADLFLMDDGAGGTIRKTTAARIKTYAGGGVNTPYFHAYSLSGQTLNHNTETKKTFSNVTESASGVFDLTNDKFTVATAGKYFLTFNILAYDSSNELRRLDVYMKKSGTQKVKFATNLVADVGGRDANVGGSFIFDLSVNDYIEMFVYQNTGDSGSIELRGASSEQSCFFGGFKLIE